ncbi:MAG: type II toxin-antitoxin system HicA family toxin [Acidobacteria bacterium]|nr:type II toxin-antitoxin system HicA family toxin [Acidobacteriota bacterium]
MKLPVCSGRGAIRAFERAGWIQDRQEGSHVSLYQPGNPVVLTVPLHRELGHGLLRDLIRKSGMTVGEFVELLKG